MKTCFSDTVDTRNHSVLFYFHSGLFNNVTLFKKLIALHYEIIKLKINVL